MRHEVTEIYTVTIKTKVSYRHIYCTMDYIKANNIPHFRDTDHYEAKWYYYTCTNINNPKREATLTDTNGSRRIYLYGEKTWFDSAVERDAYAIEATAKRAEVSLRTSAKKSLSDMIDEMPVEEVKKFMEKMGLW